MRQQFPGYQNPPEAKKATLGWWGIGSLASGLLALAFLPAALMSGGDWVARLWEVSPVWAIFCIIGIATGIRGTQFQRKATPRQRNTALAGTILSLFAFMILTMIVVILSG